MAGSPPEAKQTILVQAISLILDAIAKKDKKDDELIDAFLKFLQLMMKQNSAPTNSSSMNNGYGGGNVVPETPEQAAQRLAEQQAKHQALVDKGEELDKQVSERAVENPPNNHGIDTESMSAEDRAVYSYIESQNPIPTGYDTIADKYMNDRDEDGDEKYWNPLDAAKDTTVADVEALQDKAREKRAQAYNEYQENKKREAENPSQANQPKTGSLDRNQMEPDERAAYDYAQKQADTEASEITRRSVAAERWHEDCARERAWRGDGVYDSYKDCYDRTTAEDVQQEKKVIYDQADKDFLKSDIGKKYAQRMSAQENKDLDQKSDEEVDSGLKKDSEPSADEQENSQTDEEDSSLSADEKVAVAVSPSPKLSSSEDSQDEPEQKEDKSDNKEVEMSSLPDTKSIESSVQNLTNSYDSSGIPEHNESIKKGKEAELQDQEQDDMSDSVSAGPSMQ